MAILFLGTEGELSHAHAREEGHALPPVFFLERWPPPEDNLYPVLVPAARLILECSPPWPVPVLATGSLSLMDEAFCVGCLDYLVEPWPPQELLSRFKARAWAVGLGGGVVFQFATGCLTGPAGNLRLQPTAARLLRALVANRGQAVGKRELSLVTGLATGPSRALDMAVSRLRKCLRQVCLEGKSPTIQCEDAACILINA